MIRDEKCPTCLSPCQMNVAAIKQVVPYARFLVRASMEKRRSQRPAARRQPAPPCSSSYKFKVAQTKRSAPSDQRLTAC